MIKEISHEEFISAELGRLYTMLLWEAETSNNADVREHGHWLRAKINEKISNNYRSYH